MAKGYWVGAYRSVSDPEKLVAHGALAKPAIEAAGANPTAESAVVEVNDTTTGPRLAFHQVPEPKSLKNRLHLDLITPDFEAETTRLLALGATTAHQVEKSGRRWTTFLDPEGNEFDLVGG